MRAPNSSGLTVCIRLARNNDFEVDCTGYHLNASQSLWDVTNHVHVRCRLETKQDYSSNEWKSKNTADPVVLIGETISLFFSPVELGGYFYPPFFCAEHIC